ncbi:hypothetical protein PG989_015097 [Apiospora arundinis]
MTTVLDLPTELIHEILEHAIRVRGVKRGLRLRLVCKLFSVVVHRSLVKTELLDHLDKPDIVPARWPIQNYHGADQLWHDHFVHQVHRQDQAGDDEDNCYREVRDAASTYCTETGADLADTIDATCWLGLHWCHGVGAWPSREWTMKSQWRVGHQGHPHCCHPRLNLLCLAAYLGHKSLVQTLLEEDVPCYTHSHIFASPMQLAALAGHAKILRQLQEYVPECFDPRELYSFTWTPVGHELPSAVWGAANNGQVHILDMAVRNIPTRTNIVPSGSHLSHPMGPIRDTPDSKLSNMPMATSYKARWNPMELGVRDALDGAWAYATAEASSVEMLRYLLARYWKLPPERYIELLGVYSGYGNAEIVRYLLDLGADATYCFPQAHHGLAEACRHGYEDIVDMLLEAGADANLISGSDLAPTTTLAQAVAGGHLGIVRKLLAWGAKVHQATVKTALFLEHVEMWELLLPLCPPMEDIYKHRIGQWLRAEGLESMADIIVSQISDGWEEHVERGGVDWERFFSLVGNRAD